MAVKFDFSRLDKPFEADWPVSISVPQDGGKFEKQTFTARLLQVPPDEGKKAMGEGDDFDLKALGRLFFIGFGKDEKQAFSAELREKMLDVPYIRDGLFAAYREFNTGAASGN